MVVKILIWNTVKDKNKDYWNKKASTWPVSLGPYKNQASALQETSTASKMDCSGKIFSLFQSNSLPIHRSQVKKSHWPSRGKLWNSQRSKKTTLTHSLLIALSHRCESKHAVLVHFGPQYTPEGIPETHTHTASTHHTPSPIVSDCGGETVWQGAKLSSLVSQLTGCWGLARDLQWLVSSLESCTYLLTI